MTTRKLPSKEAALFRSALKLYEYRQYRKGLKATDQILKKVSDHGETLALKGLFLCFLGRKEEGYAAVKDGLRLDLQSHICWHVYGLVHRNDKNYVEAIKCYVQALRIDKGNFQIMRDHALLLVHTRNFDAFLDARMQILRQKSNVRASWVGIAIAYDLSGSPDGAIKALSDYDAALKDETRDYEYSEVLAYKLSLLEKTGQLDEALAFIDANEYRIFDKLALLESRGRLLMALNRYKEAEELYLTLYDKNPDSETYLYLLLQVRQLTKSCDIVAFIEEELAPKYKKSFLLKFLPLIHCHGDDFLSRLVNFLKAGLRRGVPSTFVSLKELYRDSSKVEMIDATINTFLNSLLTRGVIDENEQEPPTTLLWTYYFLGQHYDYLKQFEKALRYIHDAIAHSPTVVELYMLKAKVLKHVGDIVGAAHWMNQARELDLQDRFVNSKSVKSYLRMDNVEEATKTIALFTKADTDPLADLTEMQCIWFATESAESYYRQQEYGLALKRFNQIDKHFTEFFDDQFDFHSYCLRKCTLRSYLDLLKQEDRLRDHPYYTRAAAVALKTYSVLMNFPIEDSDLDLNRLSLSEKKKAERKAKKEKTTDEDPKGLKLLESLDVPAEALKICSTLQTMSPSNTLGWLYGCDIYLKQHKLMLALRCLLKLQSLDFPRPGLLAYRVWKLAVEQRNDLHPTTLEVLDQVLEENDVFKHESPDNLLVHVQETANTAEDMLDLIQYFAVNDPEKVDYWTERLESILNTVSVESAMNLIHELKVVGRKNTNVETWLPSLREKLKNIFLLSTCF